MNCAVTELRRKKSFRDVVEFCVAQLRGPVFFNCRHADLLTVSKDSLGDRRLVLRATSYAPRNVSMGLRQ